MNTMNGSSIDLREFACGWGAALVNICTTFPINKIMYRQMVHGVTITSAITQLKSEGWSNLYRGLLPPLLSKTASASLMFGSYAAFRTFLDRDMNHVVTHHHHRLIIAAFMSGSMEGVLAPFERVQMLLQSRDLSRLYPTTLVTLNKLRPHGLREYYRGLSCILMRNGPSNILFFGVRENWHTIKEPSTNYYVHLFEHFVTGALLGAFISTLFYPLNVIRTKIQTVSPGSPYITIREASHQVWIERGRSLRKVFYGVSINGWRALISWGIINVSYELIRSVLYPPSPSSSSSSSPSTSTSTSTSTSSSPSLHHLPVTVSPFDGPVISLCEPDSAINK